MRKRVTALLLTMVLLVSLLPMPAAAISSSERVQIRSAVEKVVKAYAKKVYQADCDDDALGDFLYHGFFGNGRTMNIKQSDPIVSAMFNSLMMQDALTEGISRGIMQMYELQLDTLLLDGSISWHGYYDNYKFEGYAGEVDNGKNYVCWVTAALDLYGEDRYTGGMNEYDEVMHLIAGEMPAEILIRQLEIKANTAVYQVDIKVHDLFDFGDNYDSLEDAGYDTTKDEQLLQMGKLLNYMGVDDFRWNYQTTMKIEAPQFCDHTAANYYWTYDADSRTMTSHSDDEFTYNYARQAALKKYPDYDYFKVDDNILLRHEDPWVLEFSLVGMEPVMLNSRYRSKGCTPYMYAYHNTETKTFRVSVAWCETNGENDELSLRYYSGLRIPYDKPFDQSHVFTYRLENRLSADGSNMLWCSLKNETTGETIFGPAAVNESWISKTDTSGLTFPGCTTDMLNGKDIPISFIADTINRLPKGFLSLKVWEKGTEGADMSVLSVKTTEASCAKPATATYTCRDCGYSYTKTTAAALPHSYGEYVYDNNATCVTDGTETATCSVCGHKTTRTVAGTAKGHNHISVTVKPTCTEVGYRNHLCRCGDEYRTDEVPALGHTPVTDAAVAATCITKGLTEGSHCEVCDAVIVAQQETATVGHTWDQGVITVEPTPDRGGTIMYTCIHCGAKDYFSVQYTEKVQFEDVNDDDYFADAVAWAAEKNITTGIGEGLFGPNEGCTRGQVVTFLWRAAGEPVPTVTENPFEDVRENDFFYTAVLWAVENGITTGAGEGRFDPDSTCTRGQIVTFLWRTFGKEAAEIENPFTDVENSAFYRDAVLWCVDHGITTGVNSEKFAPDATCTRGQVVTFLYRAMSDQ